MLDGLTCALITVKIHVGSENYFYLESLYVDKEYRKKGIGNKLMSYFLKIMPKFSTIYNINEVILIAEPLEKNIPFKILKDFYSRYGFKNVNGHKSEYMKLKIKN
jgi:ribosomal protein S18 acetylase RimI-like enzyme